MKRMLSFLLALVIITSVLPFSVFADDGVQQGFSSIFSKMFNGLDTLNGGNASI